MAFNSSRRRYTNVLSVSLCFVCNKTLFVIMGKMSIVIERFSIAFTANGKRQAKIFSLMKNNEAFLV